MNTELIEEKQIIRSGLLKGKKGVVMGLANKWSIAWGIAKCLSDAGAELTFTYQERLKERVEKLAAELDVKNLLECEVSDDESINKAFSQIGQSCGGKLDFVIHSLAFAKKEELEGRYVDTSRDGFLLALNISAFSLAAVAKAAEPYLVANGGGSIVTMSYLGGERVVPNYNVMGVAKAALENSVKYLAADLGPSGIRVNAISAGPIKTLASSAVSGIQALISEMGEVAPLRHSTDPQEVGDTALFLVSDLSRGITGELIHVDSGFHILGAVKPPA